MHTDLFNFQLKHELSFISLIFTINKKTLREAKQFSRGNTVSSHNLSGPVTTIVFMIFLL